MVCFSNTLREEESGSFSFIDKLRGGGKRDTRKDDLHQLGRKIKTKEGGKLKLRRIDII